MYKYLAMFSLVSLVGCAAHGNAACHVRSEKVIDPHPVKVEMDRGVEAQAIACSDDFDCLNKLTGLCPNGYSWSQHLLGEMNKRVGIIFICITDEEKAEIEKRKAEEAAAEEAEKAEEAYAREMMKRRTQQKIEELKK